VVNQDVGYLHDPLQCEFIDGIFDLARRAKLDGYLVVVITNQSGIARGYYTENQFGILMQWMESKFLEHEASIDAIYFCSAFVADSSRIPDCMKPSPTMFLRAKEDLKICMECSLLVGNRITDIVAGAASGIKRAFLLDEGFLSPDPFVIGGLHEVDL
jgi:D-glycero-D-manno-heptose 1,7-bisphosphate phosphatase